jgi:hypothetical protein
MLVKLQARIQTSVTESYNVAIRQELKEPDKAPFEFNPVFVSEFSFKAESFEHAKAIVNAINNPQR